MLDVQRHRTVLLREGALFTRQLLLAHLLVGLGLPALMMTLDSATWPLSAAAMYAISIVPIIGLSKGRGAWRIALAFMFFATSLVGVYFSTQVLPGIEADPAMLPIHRLRPLSLGAVNLFYFLCGLVFLSDDRIKTAAVQGVSPW